jgi:formylglycine-generating enzyme required for sulfatase activity
VAGGADQEKPVSLFYSYSHRDEELRSELEAHLSFLRRSKLIAEWHDRMIGAGNEWKGQIDRQLAAADIILLLVSADFIASDYCWGEEMTKALARHQLGEARVIPVILRPCRWQRTPLGSLQAVPKDGKPVSEWPNHDVAFDQIAVAIESTIADLQQQRRRAGEQQAEETRKRAEAKARQAIEEQQQEARRREQDEARRAAEAEATRMPKTARYSDARGRQQLKLITAVALVILAGFAGVLAWQRWPPPPAEVTRRGEEKPVVAVPAPAPAPNKGALKPLDTFTDCKECPEMVVIPGGTFTMGSPEDEEGRYSLEGPQHRVTIEPFAMGKTEVTFAEWDACVAGGGCNGYKPPDQGWGRGSRPVIKVSWKDAKAYVSWLSQYTGKPYRLPSEAEWEYAARAGKTSRYTFGDAITPKDANYSESNLGKTTEVGAYPPNAWGLYDMHGNVWEWVEDIYHDSYQGAPINGTAWIDSEGENSSRNRVIRGGSWGNYPGILRSANRIRSDPGSRSNYLGFRVART